MIMHFLMSMRVMKVKLSRLLQKIFNAGYMYFFCTVTTFIICMNHQKIISLFKYIALWVRIRTRYSRMLMSHIQE